MDELTDEQRRAVALLTDPDVGLVEASAIEHATTHTWTHILRMVANWWTDVQHGDVIGPGALHTRLQRNWTVGPITADFRRSDLCAHHAPEETFNAVVNGDLQRYRVTAYRMSDLD